MRTIVNTFQSIAYGDWHELGRIWTIPNLKIGKAQMRIVDGILLVIMAIAPAIISMALHASYFLSILLFMGIPSLYLSLRSPRAVKNSFIFSMIASVPFTIIFNSIAIFNKAWLTTSLLSIRFFSMPYEDLIFGLGLFYLTVITYQHFYGNGTFSILSKRTPIFTLILTALVALFFAIYLFAAHLLLIPYYYLLLGVVLLAFTPYLLIRYPHLRSRFAKLVAYSIIVNLCFELTALSLNQWSFPGKEFIGWVELFGNRFPLEEFIFYIILGFPGMATFLVLFGDQRTLSLNSKS